jgi:AGZA family xanthine/uracil permease-like MFS transporter
VFLLDRKPKLAAAYALAGSLLAYFGFIHGPQIGIGVSPGIALGYGLMAALCFGFAYLPHGEPAAHEVGSAEPVPEKALSPG